LHWVASGCIKDYGQSAAQTSETSAALSHSKHQCHALQRFRDIAKRQREAGIEPNRVPDDYRPKAMPLERYRGRAATGATQERSGQKLKVSMPLKHCRSAFAFKDNVCSEEQSAKNRIDGSKYNTLY